jgi:RNase P subunit RPR2
MLLTKSDKMGMYDSVMVNCPQCGKEHEFQSKSGDCLLEVYTLENCPDDVMANVNRHSPCKCDCGALFQVDISTRKAVVVD